MVDRRNLTMRDMAVAAGVLVVSLLVVVGAIGGFRWGNSTDEDPAPVAVIAIDRAAAAAELPFVTPVGLPSDWHPNSFSYVTPAVDGGDRTVVRAGWLTGSGTFVTLIQSPESAVDLVGLEVGQGLDSQGTVQAGGAEWTVFPGVRDEAAWVRSIGPVTLLVTGSATESDFQVLAAAVAAGS